MESKTPSYVERLRSVTSLDALPTQVLQSLVDEARWFELEPGESLIHESDPDRSAYLVCDGVLRVSNYTGSGRQICHELVGPGTFVGEIAILDGGSRTATLAAEGKATVGQFGAAQFKMLYRKHPEFADFLIRRLCEMLRRLMNRVVINTTLTVPRRLEFELIRMADEALELGQPMVFDPAPTHESLAWVIGSHREAVTKHLGVLKRASIVSIKGRRLEILDVPALYARVPEIEGLRH